MKKKIGMLAAAVAGVLAVGGAAKADTIQFDPDGADPTNSAVAINTFDFAVGNTLADNVFSQPVFQTYYQAVLAGVEPLSSNVSIDGLNSDFEITVVVGFDSVVTPGSTFQDLGFVLAPGATKSFIKLYYDSTVNANNDLGTGFDDGDLILDATIVSANGNFEVTGQTSSSVIGTGSFDLVSVVNSIDLAFFDDAPTGFFYLAMANGNTKLPFNSSSDISNVFSPNGDGTGSPIVPFVGTINGNPAGGGDDVQLQSDANASITVVPTPSAAMAGFGILSVLGAARRVRRPA